MRRIDIAALGAHITVGLGPDVDARTEDRLRLLWRDASADAIPGDCRPAVWVGTAPDDLPHDVPRIPSDDFPRLAADLSSIVTLAAILRRGGDGLLLHACGIADDSGRVIVFAGPSGAGKTTLAAALSRRYGYVSDETVLVTPEGRVFAYRKPLSVIDPSIAGHIKRQVAPSDLGLLAPADGELTLAALVLLDRRSDARHPFELQAIDAADAAIGLMPHLNLAAGDPRTLGRIARVSDATGGILRMRYREASEAVPAAAHLLERPPAGAGTLAAEQVSGPREPSADRLRASTATRDPDAVALASSDRVVVHTGTGLHELAPASAALWGALANGPATVDELSAALVARFGPPDSTSATDAVVRMLDILTRDRIVQYAPGWGGVHASRRRRRGRGTTFEPLLKRCGIHLHTRLPNPA